MNFFMSTDGSVSLGAFGAVKKDGFRGVLATHEEFAPPDVFVILSEVMLTCAPDAWGLGATAFWTWRNKAPETGDTVGYGILPLFKTSEDGPQPVQFLVHQFLKRFARDRPLALQALGLLSNKRWQKSCPLLCRSTVMVERQQEETVLPPRGTSQGVEGIGGKGCDGLVSRGATGMPLEFYDVFDAEANASWEMN
ncbi:hypothetical protein TGARI_296000 [Toxoplasma gondii ARI]|uniref:Protein kinase domain-containing protein n=1 Tax=Toxoplasma gondii ARI TaxID=1074872 RepID=A0A139XJT2_TOXGO|nr:hypothetical protein TGARI_296000 [Toxoplasma gondii ARI]